MHLIYTLYRVIKSILETLINNYSTNIVKLIHAMSFWLIGSRIRVYNRRDSVATRIVISFNCSMMVGI